MNLRLKPIFSITTLVGLLSSCGGLDDKVKLAQQNLTTEDTDEQNQIDMYLDDMMDSAGDTPPANAPQDPSVVDATKEEKIKKMVQKMFERFDADKSQTLSLEEFLAAPQARAEETQCSPEKKEKMITKLTEDFKKYAGDDNLLTNDELKKLLTEVGPRVGKHRSHGHPGGHGPRGKKNFAEVLAKYDANKDGQLNQEEFSTWQEEKKPHKGRKGH